MRDKKIEREEKEIIKEIQKAFEEEKEPRVKFFDSISKLKVEMIGYSHPNPYKIMLEVATCTFGDYDNITKWDKLSPKARFRLVKGVLDKRAMPLALEHIKFNFIISGISRCAFDEIVRARIGVSYGSKGWKGNFLNNIGFNIPSPLLREKYKKLKEKVEKHIRSMNKLYTEMQKAGVPHWACRFVMPMGCTYRFMMSLDYLALQQFCARRMNQTEQEDVVATAWLMRERVKEKFPLLANYLRPGEDWMNRDSTIMANSYADERGWVEHRPGVRHPVNLKEFKKKYKILHDEPCTHTEILEKYLKIKIPRPNEWKNYTWETLDEKDRKLFEED